MNRRNGIGCKVYHGDAFLGEAEAFPAGGGKNQAFPFQSNSGANELRISHLSPHSDRCPPLAILQAISPYSLRWKLQSKSIADYPSLHNLYLSCFQEYKSAVVTVGNKEELHLVAMPSKVEKVSCFWCYSVQPGLYNSCLGMLNLRCLAIVFDLDETLIVANTMKSFEDRIEALSRKIDGEEDPIRVSGMSAELKRYIEDKDLLKQFIETDTVSSNGKLVTVQNEEVLQLPGSQERIVRPVIRLQEKDIVLTRINPEIRDTSVFVRLRPAWEDLRSYLIAKGRKRFEVYVCTMAERDYALEMWRLLDPEAHLITSMQLMDRIVCVKSGLKKSLQHVFQGGICHPKMAMVIDDRLQVWEDKDQHRVHVVPAFTPYYAPHAEMSCVVPVLCVARNVACNVRGGFFKEFDENLLQKVYDLNYENEISDLPFAPDVGDYLISEDTNTGQNNSRDILMADGITGAEAEPKMKPTENFEEECPAQHQAPLNRSHTAAKQYSGSNKSLLTESGEPCTPGSSLFVSVLLEIGRRCNSKVEFKSSNGPNKDLKITVEVLFGTEKIGIGMGRTMKDAQQHAAENALHNLASDYMSFIGHITESTDTKRDRPLHGNENGFLGDMVNPPDESVKKEELHASSTLEQLSHSNNLERLSSVLSGIKELCLEGQSVIFRDKAPSSLTLNKGEHYCQVELAGKVLGHGLGLSEEQAKLKAAEMTLDTLKADINPQAQKRPKSTSS